MHSCNLEPSQVGHLPVPWQAPHHPNTLSPSPPQTKHIPLPPQVLQVTTWLPWHVGHDTVHEYVVGKTNAQTTVPITKKSASAASELTARTAPTTVHPKDNRFPETNKFRTHYFTWWRLIIFCKNPSRQMFFSRSRVSFMASSTENLNWIVPSIVVAVARVPEPGLNRQGQKKQEA